MYSMLRSMTAYSRVKKSFPHVEITIELQSINKRHLDVQTRLPPELLSFDPEIRKIVAQHIARGFINANIQVSFASEDAFDVHVNLPLAKKLHKAIEGLALQLNVENFDALSHVLKERGIIQHAFRAVDDAQNRKAIEEVLQEACFVLIEMKKKEGSLLEIEFQKRLLTLQGIIQEIAEKMKLAPERYRAKLQELFKELFSATERDDERIAKEVALLADRCDISEETSRFSLHLHHFQEVLEKPVSDGKTLEFILQEMQREINTIGSKSQDGGISQLVISAKSEIEKIREQVQNVE